MKRDRLEEGRFTENARGLGTVTREMVRRRARELATINGRDQVLDQDLEEAYRELTGEERLNPTPTAAEEVPEDARAEGLHVSTGEEVSKVPAPDEQTFAEKLVEEGVEAAEHEQMLQATRESKKRDNEGGAP